jgi:ketosteroid isomerase-like protein
MDARGTLRVMTESMDAYERRDFARLEELYAEDVQWWGVRRGETCPGRADVLELFRWRMETGSELRFDELRALPGRVMLRGHSEPDGQPFYTVFAIEDGRIKAAKDFPSREAAEAAFVSPPRR